MLPGYHTKYKLSAMTGIVSVMLALGGCNMARTWVNSTEKVVKKGLNSLNFDEPHMDSELNLTADEFKKKLLYDRISEVAAKSADKTTSPAIPDMSQILAAPQPPALDSDKLVSLSVTEDVPLKDVLIELSRIADIDIAIDPQIKGGIIFRVKDRPLKEVIEKIALLGNLRYSFINGVLRVERDMPYVENYSVDFLNMVRSSSGSVDISTQVLSASTGGGGSGGSGGSGGGGGGSSGGGGGVSTGSSNAITTQYDGDLWKSVEEGIKQVLLEGKAGGAAATAVNVASNPEQLVQAAATTDDNRSKDALLYINRQAGIVSVLANQKQQRAIRSYLDHVREISSAQVLIEAKIVEVTLNEDFRTGINWDLVDKVSGLQFSSNLSSTLGSTATDLVSVGLFKKDNLSLESAVNMTQMFGSSRALSSPRLHAINNQQSVLTFAENEVYFTIEFEEEEADTGSGTTTNSKTTSEVHTVPIGVILAIQPSINLEKNEITMNIRPTLSRITGRVSDPGVALKAQQLGVNVTSEVPVIEVREMDSVLKIKSGQVMVIGGLMEERAENNNSAVPGLHKLPLIGQLFKAASNTSEMVETVIFIKATIVPGSTSDIDKSDRKLYKDFIRDPRPLAF